MVGYLIAYTLGVFTVVAILHRDVVWPAIKEFCVVLYTQTKALIAWVRAKRAK